MISVITPVYNAKDYLIEAVESVIYNEIVKEVILIFDGSKDGSKEVCKILKDKYSKVKVFFHENFENKGPSVSRNLGIICATTDWICFLDSDDLCLPNRFDEFINLIDNKVYFDGLYEAVQYFNGSNKVFGISKELNPINLFHYLIRGTYGHFHTNGLIVKRDLLIKAGLFVESLHLHQDSDLWLKISFYGKLISGKPGLPVAKVRVHEGNRIWNGTSSRSRYKQIKVTWDWAKNEKVGIFNKLLLLRKLVRFKISILFES